MIYQSEQDSVAAYREWVSNFSERIFVMLKVYADETGTHDGADVIALSGLIESREYWEKFNGKWSAVLKNYDADYFHFREFRKDANTTPGKPYYGWSDEKRRNFLFRLAMLVGESAVPTGSSYPAKYNQERGLHNDPIEATIRTFYQSVLGSLDTHWPDHSGRVLFIFDKCSKREWTGPLHEIHEEYRSNHDRIGGMAFEDDKDPKHLGLQAADFSAVHARNNTRGYIEDGKIFDATIMDFITGKNVDPVLRNLPKEKIEKIFAEMRADEALQRKNGFTGAYIPLKHFDFAKYGYKK